jgi:hypothetical protein
MKNKIKIIVLAIFPLIYCSCKKFVEVDGPANLVSSSNVFNNDATAAGAITALYVKLSIGNYAADLALPEELTSLSCTAGVSSDELRYYNGANKSVLAAYYQNNLTNLNIGNPDYWAVTYENLFSVNLALEGLSTSMSLTPKVKNQLLGEAKFMRAFYYFYLVNLYGDVPLVLTSDYMVNALITKSTKSQVYQQIIIDLKEAQNLLSENYLKGDALTSYPSGAEERVRPTKWAATALMARTYLYLGDWANAEKEATLVLNNVALFKLASIDQTFLKNNKEAIWQLQPSYKGSNTLDADLFVILSAGPSDIKPVYLNEDLLKDFTVRDKRKTNWISSIIVDGVNYSFSYKYKVVKSAIVNAPVTEYHTVMRLAEQYLIRAEARTQLDNNRIGAIEDLDKVRNRAGLDLIGNINPGINKKDLLTDILDERRLELFTEWGHRWLDLKRTGKIDEVMTIATPKKENGLVWKSNQQYYPISSSELKTNPNLTQVSGY